MLALAIALTGSTTLFAGSHTSDAVREPCVLWREPIDLGTRNLFYGAGGEADQPHGNTFTFVEEDLAGTNPKFVVRDDAGTKWKIKLGTEARPETAASRLVWAVGYSADEDYFLPAVQVRDMPSRVHRGQRLIGPGGTMADVRLKREAGTRQRVGEWQWRSDPFTGTRELNGLRVLMATINNWDLKDVNNAVLHEGSRCIYEISDLGASFGSPGLTRTKATIGEPDDYRGSRFMTRITDDSVDFESPRRADWIVLANPREFFMRLRLRWIGRQIPREDARWMGQLLARLSPDQLRDAFRAAGYTPGEIDEVTAILESRIAQLRQL